MPGYSNAELAEIRLIDTLVREEMRRQGLPLANPKPFDDLVASGELKAAECRVLGMTMVDPNWCERATSGQKDIS